MSDTDESSLSESSLFPLLSEYLLVFLLESLMVSLSEFPSACFSSASLSSAWVVVEGFMWWNGLGGGSSTFGFERFCPGLKGCIMQRPVVLAPVFPARLLYCLIGLRLHWNVRCGFKFLI